MKTKNINLNPSLRRVACTGAALLMTWGASAQNLFVSDYSGGNVFKITPGGVQSTVASGMSYPTGLAFDSAGDLCFGNSDNNNGENGNITEIAANGTQSTFASGVDPQGMTMSSSGILFQVDYRSGNVYEYTPKGVQNTFATGFSNPLAVAINGLGDVFVSAGWGTGNGYITEITPNGTQSLFASGLSFPHGLAFNNAGDLFVSSEQSGAISEFAPNGTKSTFATTTA